VWAEKRERRAECGRLRGKVWKSVDGVEETIAEPGKKKRMAECGRKIGKGLHGLEGDEGKYGRVLTGKRERMAE
jgi:hypothetical protein